MTSMAAPTPEAAVLDVLALRAVSKMTMPEDLQKRIHTIRDFCIKAEQSDSVQVPWRRGGGGSSGGGSRGGSHGGGGGGPSRWRGQPPSRPSGANPGGPPPGRYVSKFTNSEAPVEDKILNQVILNKLNKFSAVNYDEVKAFLQQVLDSNETDFLHDFMLLVFKKAAAEPTFCPLYARMISELSEKYNSLIHELTTLYNEYLTVFEEVSEEQCKDYEQFVQRNREKMHRLGYSQFLGELTRTGILELGQLKALFCKVLDQLQTAAKAGESKQLLVEEYVDCLLRMTSAFKGCRVAKVNELRKQLAAACEPIIQDILARRSKEFPGLSKKASFALMDCLDIFRMEGGNASA